MGQIILFMCKTKPAVAGDRLVRNVTSGTWQIYSLSYHNTSTFGINHYESLVIRAKPSNSRDQKP